MWFWPLFCFGFDWNWFSNENDRLLSHLGCGGVQGTWTWDLLHSFEILQSPGGRPIFLASLHQWRVRGLILVSCATLCWCSPYFHLLTCESNYSFTLDKPPCQLSRALQARCPPLPRKWMPTRNTVTPSSSTQSVRTSLGKILLWPVIFDH